MWGAYSGAKPTLAPTDNLAVTSRELVAKSGYTIGNIWHTVSSSAERGIMCDKILGPDTLNVDMGDFVWNNTASCKCRIWNEVQLISVCCPSLHFWLVIKKKFWSCNWGAPIWWAVCTINDFYYHSFWIDGLDQIWCNNKSWMVSQAMWGSIVDEYK